ncbi:hypothetical protein NC653_040422 [Populus alba x Populus x berolinensis]|uniref:Uncharacterized protein n=1 Tax=Populus alba x Populus x berolinensis TaxID=444605 RepID=A0AAD6LDL6_9ROSI|nr:hypothetical protein NC653_040422 [Populus alba x Populus x berolinensis]
MIDQFLMKPKLPAAFKAQIEKLQQERDEFQRMVIGNQQVRTQQIHEMKKKEKEYIKLQERLKPSVNGEKEGITIRHGDNEFASERRAAAWDMERKEG